MNQVEIINEIKHFSLKERIKIIDEALHSVVEELKEDPRNFFPSLTSFPELTSFYARLPDKDTLHS